MLAGNEDLERPLMPEHLATRSAAPPATLDDPELLGTLAAAHYLGLHRSTLHLAVKQGVLTADARTPGGHARFRRASLDALRARIGVASATGETALVAPLRALAELAQAARRATTPDDLWRATVAAVRRALPGIDWVTVALTAPKPGDPFAVRPLTRHVLPDRVSRDFQRMRHTVEFATTTALRTLEAAICEDVAAEEAPAGSRRLARIWRFAAFAIYPIIGEEQAAGLLICISASPRRFSAADRTFLLAAAGQLALALDRAPSGGPRLAWEAPPTREGEGVVQADH